MQCISYKIGWDWDCMSVNNFEKDEIIVTRNQKKAKRWIKNHINWIIKFLCKHIRNDTNTQSLDI